TRSRPGCRWTRFSRGCSRTSRSRRRGWSRRAKRRDSATAETCRAPPRARQPPIFAALKPGYRPLAPPRSRGNSGLEGRRVPMVAFMRPLEPLGEQVQAGVAKTLRLDLAHRGEHVIAIGPRVPMTLPHVTKLLFEIEPAGILRMAAID